MFHDYELEQDKSRLLPDKIAWLQENVDVCDQQLAQFAGDRGRIAEELSTIKEEAANHITKIAMLENEKRQLIEELQVKSDYEKALQDKISLLHEHFELREEEMIRNKVTFDERFAQQMKLIEYLKDKVDANKKKVLYSLAHLAASTSQMYYYYIVLAHFHHQY